MARQRGEPCQVRTNAQPCADHMVASALHSIESTDLDIPVVHARKRHHARCKKHPFLRISFQVVAAKALRVQVWYTLLWRVVKVTVQLFGSVVIKICGKSFSIFKGYSIQYAQHQTLLNYKSYNTIFTASLRILLFQKLAATVVPHTNIANNCIRGTCRPKRPVQLWPTKEFKEASSLTSHYVSAATSCGSHYGLSSDRTRANLKRVSRFV